MDDDSLARAALARAYVPPHKRMTASGLVDVEGYWREIGELDILGGKMTDIDGGVRIQGAGHHWDLTYVPDSKAVEVNEDNGIQVTDHSDMGAALSHVKTQLRSARQIRDSYVAEEGRGVPGGGEAFRYLKRMMKGIRVGAVPREGTAPGYFSNVDRLVVKLARKVYVAPHKRVTAKGTVNVSGFWRELPVSSHPTIPGATWNPSGFKPGAMHEGPIVSMRVPGQNMTVERGEVYQWTEANGEVKTARFTGNAVNVTTAQRQRVHAPEFRDVDTGERLQRTFIRDKNETDYTVTKLGDTPGEFPVGVPPLPARPQRTMTEARAAAREALEYRAASRPIPKPAGERDIEAEIMNSELVDQTNMVDDFLDEFGIEKTPKHREQMRDLLIRQGPTAAHKTLKSIHSQRWIIGGPPRNRRQLNKM